jgi:hypothetical protein
VCRQGAIFNLHASTRQLPQKKRIFSSIDYPKYIHRLHLKYGKRTI